MVERLGILVNTNRHPDYVRELAAAAHRRRKRVFVHFYGDGLEIVDHPMLAALDRLAAVSLAEDRRSSSAETGSDGAGLRTMALSQFFLRCDRCVVF